MAVATRPIEWQKCQYSLEFCHADEMHQRILSAQQLLEKTDRPIDWIAESVGLQTAATLRDHFRRMLKTTPTAYRRAFFVAEPTSPSSRPLASGPPSG